MEFIDQYSSRESQSSHGFNQKPNPKKKLEVEGTNRINLKIESASFIISKTKDLQRSLNLRWVRDSKKNRDLLLDFLISSTILPKLLQSKECCYLPCCNVFCHRFSGKGHHGVQNNPLLFLLEEEEKGQVMNFKKDFEEKKGSCISHADYPYQLKRHLFNFIKTELHLKKLRSLIDNLTEEGWVLPSPFEEASL